MRASDLMGGISIVGPKDGESATDVRTDIPAFYERFGAKIHEQVTAEFSVMRIDLKE